MSIMEEIMGWRMGKMEPEKKRKMMEGMEAEDMMTMMSKMMPKMMKGCMESMGSGCRFEDWRSFSCRFCKGDY